MPLLCLGESLLTSTRLHSPQPCVNPPTNVVLPPTCRQSLLPCCSLSPLAARRSPLGCRLWAGPHFSHLLLPVQLLSPIAPYVSPCTFLHLAHVAYRCSCVLPVASCSSCLSPIRFRLSSPTPTFVCRLRCLICLAFPVSIHQDVRWLAAAIREQAHAFCRTATVNSHRSESTQVAS